MSDTRMMPKAALRSTGINNTTANVPRVVGSGAAANMSASAGAPADSQKAVRQARQLPDTLSQGRGGQRVATPRRAQDAKVTVINTGATRIRSGSGVVGMGAGVLPSPFNQDQLLLVGHLLDQYVGTTTAANDAKNSQLAQGTLDVVAALLQASAQAHAAPTQTAPVQGQVVTSAAANAKSVVLMPAPPLRSAAAQAAVAAKEASRAARAQSDDVAGDEPPEAA